MIKIITGTARSGKTSAIFEEIRLSVENRQGGRVLIIPEQYSHEAERALCAICGPSMSLYADVLSFTELSRRVLSDTGGIAEPFLDEPGRLLCMSEALSNCKSGLKEFRLSAQKPEMQNSLLKSVDELKTMSISPGVLNRASEMAEGALKDKLKDLAVIMSAYDAVVANGHADPNDVFAITSIKIPFSSIEPGSAFYIDGFSDFSASEFLIIKALMQSGADLTFCFTTDGKSDIFAQSGAEIARIRQTAEKLGLECVCSHLYPKSGSFADSLFGLSGKPFSETVELYKTDGIYSECEFAAKKAMELVSSGRCRLRDIAVTARGFEDYRPNLESAFAERDIALFVADMAKLSSKPLCALIEYAYSITLFGWNSDDMLSYLGTGLSGLSFEEQDLLSGYIYKWDLREGNWRSKKPWGQHPDGYGGEFDDSTRNKLDRINALRDIVATPLINFADRNEKAGTAGEYAENLTEFLREAHIAENLSERARELKASGREALGDECRQLWDILVSAIEQVYAILQDTRLETERFARLFTLMLSKYEVGTIPTMLDSVTAGDIDRMRRRDIKYLIVLGATDDRIPAQRESGGVFTREDIDELDALDIPELKLGQREENGLWREFNMVYNCLSLPGKGVYISCPGENASFIYNRAKTVSRAEEREYECDPRPSLKYPPRGTLSKGSVEALYGRRIPVTPSRIDKYYSCRYRHFCEYGLLLREKAPASFDASSTGTFVHYVLENTARECREKGGFKVLSDDQIFEIAEYYMGKYQTEELGGLEDESPRFKWLFGRIKEDTLQVVKDTASEIRKSGFEPELFENKFETGGIADRIDSCETEEGKLVRVVDYKTGHKTFSLKDVWYGLGLQMLMYLYELSTDPENKIIPAGVEYVPARNEIPSMPKRPASDEEIQKKRDSDLKRTGIMLSEHDVPRKWSTEKTGLQTMSEEQFRMLCSHIDVMKDRMRKEISDGIIDANPFNDVNGNSCDFCPMKGKCGFEDEQNGESLRTFEKLKPEQVWELIGKEAGENA